MVWIESAQRPKAIEAGRTFGRGRDRRDLPVAVLNARRRSKRGGLRSRDDPTVAVVVLNARRRSKRGGRAAPVRLPLRQPVLNARRRSKRGGLRGDLQGHPGLTSAVLNARRRSKRGGPRPSPGVGGRRRCDVLNARRRSKRGGPLTSGAYFNASRCSTPEGDRSGADAPGESPGAKPMLCSTPEGDRSGADHLLPGQDWHQHLVLNARRRSKRGGHLRVNGAPQLGAVLNARRRSKRGGLALRAPRGVLSDLVLNARRRSKRGGPADSQPRPRWRRAAPCAQRPKAIEAGRTGPRPRGVPRGPRCVLNARRRSKRGGRGVAQPRSLATCTQRPKAIEAGRTFRCCAETQL